MTVKECLRRWMLAYVQPEFFYLPFKSNKKMHGYCFVFWAKANSNTPVFLIDDNDHTNISKDMVVGIYNRDDELICCTHFMERHTQYDPETGEPSYYYELARAEPVLGYHHYHQKYPGTVMNVAKVPWINTRYRTNTIKCYIDPAVPEPIYENIDFLDLPDDIYTIKVFRDRDKYAPRHIENQFTFYLQRQQDEGVEFVYINCFAEERVYCQPRMWYQWRLNPCAVKEEEHVADWDETKPPDQLANIYVGEYRLGSPRLMIDEGEDIDYYLVRTDEGSQGQCENTSLLLGTKSIPLDELYSVSGREVGSGSSRAIVYNPSSTSVYNSGNSLGKGEYEIYREYSFYNMHVYSLSSQYSGYQENDIATSKQNPPAYGSGAMWIPNSFDKEYLSRGRWISNSIAFDPENNSETMCSYTQTGTKTIWGGSTMYTDGLGVVIQTRSDSHYGSDDVVLTKLNPSYSDDNNYAVYIYNITSGNKLEDYIKATQIAYDCMYGLFPGKTFETSRDVGLQLPPMQAIVEGSFEALCMDVSDDTNTLKVRRATADSATWMQYKMTNVVQSSSVTIEKVTAYSNVDWDAYGYTEEIRTNQYNSVTNHTTNWYKTEQDYQDNKYYAAYLYHKNFTREYDMGDIPTDQ